MRIWPGWRFKGGAMAMIEAWIGSVDAEMARRLPPKNLLR
jgi:hypothetical protein